MRKRAAVNSVARRPSRDRAVSARPRPHFVTAEREIETGSNNKGRPIGRARRVPELKPGKYSDGLPLDEVKYLECKLILKPNHFTSRESLFDFCKVLRRPAKEHGVGFEINGFAEEPLQIREVLFLDTADFRLYNNAFILRRRIPYKDGFPIGDPEIVFKYRHPDLQKAAEVDVRPKVSGDFLIKFKSEALPLKDQIGGLRFLYSHNVQFGLSRVELTDPTSWHSLAEIFPALSILRGSNGQHVKLVSDVIVEEVLQDLAVLDFGKGTTGKANVALWRAPGAHKALIGEFAFQLKFKRADDVHQKARQRCEEFFRALQNDVRDWVSLGTTKTGAVYRFKGNRRMPTSEVAAR